VTRHSDPPRRRGDEGFTLLEVLIAMIILSVGLLALEGLAVGAARTTASASRRSQYAEQATDYMERTLSALREGQGAANATVPLLDNSGTRAANLTVTVTDRGVLASPSPANRRWDVTVRVIPTNTSRLADSVNLVASVIQ
jgi:prepilin-type N-terminal cleavage/methylation domain-containing protein